MKLKKLTERQNMCEVIFYLISFSFKPQDSCLPSFFIVTWHMCSSDYLRSLFSIKNQNGIQNKNIEQINI